MKKEVIILLFNHVLEHNYQTITPKFVKEY